MDDAKKVLTDALVLGEQERAEIVRARIERDVFGR
jgi:hypothetical protein